jgi:hypothetical protein
MKVDAKNTRLVLSGVQSGANTDLIESVEVDPFDRYSGFAIRAIDMYLEPSDLYDIAADATVTIEVWAASAVPTERYALGDKRVIARASYAVALTTSGIAVIDCNRTWTHPLGIDTIVGADYLGFTLETAGASSAVAAEVVIHGDAVTLTEGERDASMARFV